MNIAVLNTPQKYWVTRLQTSNFSLLECVASKGEKKAIFCVRIAVKMMAKIMVKMQLTMTVMVIGWPIQWSHTQPVS